MLIDVAEVDEGLKDNFDTPRAMAAIFALIGAVYTYIRLLSRRCVVALPNRGVLTCVACAQLFAESRHQPTRAVDHQRFRSLSGCFSFERAVVAEPLCGFLAANFVTKILKSMNFPVAHN